jgi:hypothetical protein
MLKVAILEDSSGKFFQTHEERINKDRGFEKGIVQGIDK